LALLVSSNAAAWWVLAEVQWAVSYPSAFSLMKARNTGASGEISARATALTGLSHSARGGWRGKEKKKGGFPETAKRAFASYFGTYLGRQDDSYCLPGCRLAALPT